MTQSLRASGTYGNSCLSRSGPSDERLTVKLYCESVTFHAK
jgi:hypothetical protein